ncbi:unnamed protein product [Pleuronectes platessa]|uniref:Uncharacterized protein n=1 Tax=Pleuronectes platessa TaxID=8262 RepID=A0A9N7UF31_PLEPL|nr:unnamed protein product [Pleuronectes platessa]
MSRGEATVWVMDARSLSEVGAVRGSLGLSFSLEVDVYCSVLLVILNSSAGETDASVKRNESQTNLIRYQSRYSCEAVCSLIVPTRRRSVWEPERLAEMLAAELCNFLTWLFTDQQLEHQQQILHVVQEFSSSLKAAPAPSESSEVKCVSSTPGCHTDQIQALRTFSSVCL